MKKYLVVKIREEKRISGGCSPDDPEYKWILDDCLKSTGFYDVDKENALKEAENKNKRYKDEGEKFGIITIETP